MPDSESTILHAIRKRYGREPDLTLWRNETGATNTLGIGRAYLERILRALIAGNGHRAVELVRAQLEQRQALIRYGLCRGSSDLVGILAPTGRWISLEVKTPTGRLTVEQKLFLRLVRHRGGFAAVVRSVDEAGEAIGRAREGQSE